MASSVKSNVKAGLKRAKRAGENVVDETSASVSEEFHNFVADIEDLIKSSSSLTGDDLAAAKEKLSERISEAKAHLGEVGESIAERARCTAEAADEYVHEQPWTAVGAGAAFGLLVGFLLARRG